MHSARRSCRPWTFACRWISAVRRRNPVEGCDTRSNWISIEVRLSECKVEQDCALNNAAECGGEIIFQRFLALRKRYGLYCRSVAFSITVSSVCSGPGWVTTCSGQSLTCLSKMNYRVLLYKHKFTERTIYYITTLNTLHNSINRLQLMDRVL